MAEGKHLADVLRDLNYLTGARDSSNVENKQAVEKPVPAAPSKQRAHESGRASEPPREESE